MKTPWHNAFVASMLSSDVWIGVTSESEMGKHFIWADGTALTYTQWRLLHPTHHDRLNSGERISAGENKN
jgi:hypothetical protein